MDPNETLRRLHALLGGDHSAYRAGSYGIEHSHGSAPALQPDAVSSDDMLSNLCEAEELWQGLCDWMLSGAFLPEEWSKNR